MKAIAGNDDRISFLSSKLTICNERGKEIDGQFKRSFIMSIFSQKSIHSYRKQNLIR